MKNPEKLVTIIIGERSNLSYNLFKRFNNVEVFSSALLLKSLLGLSKFHEKKVNIIFNNFQPSSNLNSLADPCKYIDLSIALTMRVLMNLIDNGTTINQIIYTSSCSVYGDLEREGDYNQTSPMGIPSSLKYLNEQILREVCDNYGIRLTIARIFNIFGGNDEFSVISKIYNCYINKTKLNILNEGKSIRDYVHIENIVDVYETLLFKSTLKIDTIDIGSGKAQSVDDILNYLSNKGFNIDTESSRRKEINFSQANISMISKIIDITEFVDVNLYLLDKLSNFDMKNNF